MKIKQPKLRACPFCGSESVKVHINGYSIFHIQCSKCRASTGDYFEVTAASINWNRRSAFVQWTKYPEDTGCHWAMCGKEIRGLVLVEVQEEDGDWYVRHQGNPRCLLLEEYIDAFHVHGFSKINYPANYPALPKKKEHL